MATGVRNIGIPNPIDDAADSVVGVYNGKRVAAVAAVQLGLATHIDHSAC